MSVIITNVSTHDDEQGTNQYVVRINHNPIIARFDHVRSEGLAMCLRRAADAVDAALGKKDHSKPVDPVDIGPGYVVPFSAATKAAMDKLGKEDA